MAGKVSVIITTHNRVHMLKQAVSSVLKQTYKNLECIVVDDASTDETNEYLDTLSQENIIVVRISKSESRGGNYARNKGISVATGDYIAFLDDDDFWLSSKVEKQVNELETSNKVGLVYCGRIIYVDNKFAFAQLPDPIYKGDLSELVFGKIFCTTSAIMVRKSLLQEIKGFDESLAFWQEYDLLIRICQLTEISYVNEALIVFRNNFKDSNRLSNKYAEWKKAVKLIYKKYDYIITTLPEAIQISMKRVYLENASSRCYASGQSRELKKILKEIYQFDKTKVNFVKYIFNLSSQQIIYIKYRLNRYSLIDVDCLLAEILGDGEK